MDGILRVFVTNADQGEMALEIGFTLKPETNIQSFANEMEMVLEKYCARHNFPDVQIY